MYENWMNYNNLFITCEQMTNDVQVKTTFSGFFAYIIKELLTKSDMVTNDMDKDMNRQEQLNEPTEVGTSPNRKG